MFNFMKTHSKLLFGALIGAFLAVAAMTQTTADDAIAAFLSEKSGISVTVVTPTTVVAQ